MTESHSSTKELSINTSRSMNAGAWCLYALTGRLQDDLLQNDNLFIESFRRARWGNRDLADKVTVASCAVNAVVRTIHAGAPGPPDVPNFLSSHCLSSHCLIALRQHQNQPLPLDHRPKIPANRLPFTPSHLLLSSPYLLPSPLLTSNNDDQA
jgi:hypothetical protein